MTINFEIYEWRTENARMEKNTIADIKIEVERETFRSNDIENVKALITELLDKLKKT